MKAKPFAVPGQIEEWEAWRVVNMHAENFFEVASRLKMSSVEVHLLRFKVQEFGYQEHKGYAVVTDPRIPRSWYLSEPHLDSKTARALRAAYLESFRASD